MTQASEKFVDTFIKDTWGEMNPDVYRTLMIGAVKPLVDENETLRASLQRRIGEAKIAERMLEALERAIRDTKDAQNYHWYDQAIAAITAANGE